MIHRFDVCGKVPFVLAPGLRERDAECFTYARVPPHVHQKGSAAELRLVHPDASAARGSPRRLAQRAGMVGRADSHSNCFPASYPQQRALYTPSKIELSWVNGSVLGNVCKIGHEPDQIAAATAWMEYAMVAWEGGPQPKPTHNQSEALSAFKLGDGVYEHIEPLTGVARHPLFLHSMLCSTDDKRHRWNAIPYQYDTRYLVLASACPTRGGDHDNRHGNQNATCNHRPAGARSRFYDLGCSLPFGDAGRGGQPVARRREDVLRGGMLGPSIATFQELYRRRCVEFDDFYAWEAQSYNPSTWWQGLPIDVRARMHFYNVPVEEGAQGQAQNGSYAGTNSFLNLLLASAKPKDFVVVKVDIEGQLGAPEFAIVESIATRPELTALVDEIFFECHFYSMEHSSKPSSYPSGWGPLVQRRTADGRELETVDDALRVMHLLRSRGIRSHFWV